MATAKQYKRTPLEILSELQNSPLVRAQMLADPMAAWGLAWSSYLLTGGDESFRRVYLAADVSDDGKEHAFGGAFAVDETLYQSPMVGAVLSGAITELDLQAQAALAPLYALKQAYDYETWGWGAPTEVKITLRIHREKQAALWTAVKDDVFQELQSQFEQSYFPSAQFGEKGPVYTGGTIEGLGSVLYVDAPRLARAADLANAFAFGWWQPAKLKKILNFPSHGTGISPGRMEPGSGSFYDRALIIQRHGGGGIGVDIKDAQRVVYYQQEIVKEMKRDPMGYSQALDGLGIGGEKVAALSAKATENAESKADSKKEGWWERQPWYMKFMLAAVGGFVVTKLGTKAIDKSLD